MNITVRYPCGRKPRIENEFAGKHVRCPACRHAVTVPKRDGLVESDGDGEGDAGSQKAYRLTSEGAVELDEWLREHTTIASPAD